MKIRTLAQAAFFLILPFLLLSCGKEEKKQENFIRPVKTMVINQPESSILRVFPGVTLASNETTMAFQIPGQIIQLPILEGDNVKKDSVIAALDPVKYQEAVNDFSAKLTRDKGNYDRASQLVKQGYISQSDYDKVKSMYLSTQANYNSAVNDLKNTKLIAPFDGVIAKKFVNKFEYITAKEPIALLQDRNTIDMEINVPENIIVNLKSGQIDREKIAAVFDALPGEIFAVRLKEYSSQGSTDTNIPLCIYHEKTSQF